MATESDVSVPEVTRAEAISAVVKMVVGLILFLGVIALLSAHFRQPIEQLGRTLVARFGAPGMALGAFLADGAHFPIPPQFYLLAGEAGGMARLPAVASVLLGSVLGGLMAFTFGRRVSRVRFVESRIRAPKELVSRLFARHGYLGIAIAGMLPISFWVICTLLGALRMPFRAYAVIALVRVPRLLLSYAVVALAWGPHGSATSTSTTSPRPPLAEVAALCRTLVPPCHATATV